MTRYGRAFSPGKSAPADGFLRKLQRQVASPGEKRLALAILKDALRCRNGRHHRWECPARLFRWEAEQWFDSRNRAPLFSFENICTILALDPTRLRRQVRGGAVIVGGH